MELQARPYTRFELLLSLVRTVLVRARRKLPYLVWWNDELDVCVTFKDDKLRASTLGGAAQQFGVGYLPDIKTKLNEIGISFDSGMGLEGRDWEWDWSLQGPISVKFRGRSARPELRE